MEIRFVDGFLIRNTTHEGFGALHKHGTRITSFADRFYIPEGEIWVDHIYKKSGEVDFMIKMDELTDKYLKEHPDGDYRTYAKSFCEKGPLPDFYRKKEIMDGLTIAHVDGAIIRKYFDPEFIMGGHEFVYDYVPKNEIWLDSWLDPKEVPYILIHEQVERKLMNEGKNYDNAHEYANIAEKELRDKNGVGNFPGFENYKWRELSNPEIFEKYYVDRSLSDGILKVKHFIQSPAFCGPASLKIALSYFGEDVDEGELAKLTDATRENGTEHEGMIKAGKKFGEVIVKENGTTKDLEYFVNEKKLPVIVGWFDKDGDHYSVVVGITEKGLILSDPAWHEPHRYINKESFPNMWFDFVGDNNTQVSWGWFMVLTLKGA